MTIAQKTAELRNQITMLEMYGEIRDKVESDMKWYTMESHDADDEHDETWFTPPSEESDEWRKARYQAYQNVLKAIDKLAGLK